MTRAIKIGNHWVGDGYPTLIVAEIGINHNGDLQVAKQLIQAAKHAGVVAVKFQKRTPELCVPPDQRGQMRDTPWGTLLTLIIVTKSSLAKQSTGKLTATARNWVSPGLLRYGTNRLSILSSSFHRFATRCRRPP
jgi:N-acetylneuraminate synthase